MCIHNETQFSYMIMHFAMNHMFVFSFGLVCQCRLNDFTAGTIRNVHLDQKENLQGVSRVPVTAVNQK